MNVLVQAIFIYLLPNLNIIVLVLIRAIGNFWAHPLTQPQLVAGGRRRRVAGAEVDPLTKNLLQDLLKCWRQQLQGLQEPAGPAGLMQDLQMGSPPKHTLSRGEGETFGSLGIKLCHGERNPFFFKDSQISFQKCFVVLVWLATKVIMFLHCPLFHNHTFNICREIPRTFIYLRISSANRIHKMCQFWDKKSYTKLRITNNNKTAQTTMDYLLINRKNISKSQNSLGWEAKLIYGSLFLHLCGLEAPYGSSGRLKKNVAIQHNSCDT